MNTKIRFLLRWSSLLILLLGLSVLGPLSGSGVALAAPAAARAVDALPAATCTQTGPSARTCELWARAGTLALPDATTVPIWGYTDQVTGTAQLPGPVIIANQGETLTVILHNDLAEQTALVFPGQDILPDLTGVAPGGMGTYTFNLDNPGTFLYEAGLLPNGARQVAMGLYGALIVRPAGNPGWAYDDPDTAFDDEALLLLSEIDPAFNADPAAFDMVNFQPAYFLLNGAAYPDTAPVATDAGRRVLLRQVNAGVEHRSLGLLGLHQVVLATDGKALTYPYQVVAETIAAGQTLDMLVSIPGGAAAGVRYPLYETSGRVHNGGQLSGSLIAFGGMLTFLEIPAGVPGPDLLGPLVSAALVTPNPTAGSFGITLTATLSDLSTGGGSVVAGEFFTDTLGAPGTGVPFAIGAPSTTVAVSVYVPPAALVGLSAGEHIYYLRGQDGDGNWGPVGSAPFELVSAGPMISGQYLSPNPTNGSSAVEIQATGDARPMGPANVVAAEYFIDTLGVPGSGTPMSLNLLAPVSSLTATIPLNDVAPLAEGQHTIYIRAQDSLGNWGGAGEAILNVDKTGPGASSIIAAPSPNNGYRSILPQIQVLHVQGMFMDPLMNGVNSDLEWAEGFIDTPGTPGTGFPLIAAQGGVFDRPQEKAYMNIPLLTIRQLDPGPHTIYLHARDVAGNWGDYGSAVLIIDTAGPEVTGLDIQPNPTQGATGVILTGTAADPANPGGAPASNVVAAEWFDGSDPGAGQGYPIGPDDGAFDSSSEGLYQAISVIGWHPGEHILSVRGRDEAGNWGPVVTYSLVIHGNGPGGILEDDFESGNLDAWSQVQGAVSVAPEAAQDGTLLGMAAVVDGTAPAYVVDTTPGNEAFYMASFYFHPNGTDTADGQHDILVARDGRGTPIFGLQFEHNTGAGYEVQAWARTRTGMAYTGWVEIGNASHRLQLDWRSGQDASLGLSVDRAAQQRLTGLDTSDYLVDEAWLGPSGNLVAGMSGTEYFDQFNAIRAMYTIFLPLVIR